MEPQVKGNIITHNYSTEDIRGNVFVGGIVGQVNDSNTITHNYSTGEISGHNSVGGIVGNAVDNNTITHNYSTGIISGIKFIGGVVGDVNDNNTITHNYSTGIIRGIRFVGGIAGEAHNSNEIVHNYSTGEISGYGGSIGIGGIVGSYDTRAVYETNRISNCFYNIDSIWADHNDIGTGIHAKDFGKVESFAGWRFAPGVDQAWSRNWLIGDKSADGVWEMRDGHPQLVSNPEVTSQMIKDVSQTLRAARIFTGDYSGVGSRVPLNNMQQGVFASVQIFQWFEGALDYSDLAKLVSYGRAKSMLNEQRIFANNPNSPIEVLWEIKT